MQRRKFIMVLGGVVTWSVAARAQQSEQKRRVGVLIGLAADDSEAQDRIAAFEQGLLQLGWTEGANLQIDYRRGAGGTDLTRKYANELVALAPDVILASGGTVVGPLLQATRNVPIVFTQTPDPVAAGFVASLAHYLLLSQPRWITCIYDISITRAQKLGRGREGKMMTHVGEPSRHPRIPRRLSFCALHPTWASLRQPLDISCD